MTRNEVMEVKAGSAQITRQKKSVRLTSVLPFGGRYRRFEILTQSHYNPNMVRTECLCITQIHFKFTDISNPLVDDLLASRDVHCFCNGKQFKPYQLLSAGMRVAQNWQSIKISNSDMVSPIGSLQSLTLFLQTTPYKFH